MSDPRLSVIVPTHNRAGLLDGALASLAAQRGDTSGFEVVVVDDGSTDGTAEVVARHREAGLPVRRVHQPNAGLNAARNLGASAASGELLLYLDDDVIAGPGWLEAMARAWRDHHPAAVAGPVRLRFEAPPPAWLGPRLHPWLSALDGPVEPGWLEPPALPVGANFGLAAIWFHRLGGFRAGLDRRGTSLLSSGDVELLRRLHTAGGRVRWCPDAWVVHRVPPERLTKAWFRRRAFDQGVSDALLEPPARWRELLRAGRAAAILAKGGGGAVAREHAGLWLRYCAGRIRGGRRHGAQPCGC
jgi:glycosyltransferase involved in cell wall biosynthesis